MIAFTILAFGWPMSLATAKYTSHPLWLVSHSALASYAMACVIDIRYVTSCHINMCFMHG